MKGEKCNCELEYPLVLQWDSTVNPIVCSNCNLTSKAASLPKGLLQKIDKWNRNYQKAYRKWLNGEEPVEALTNPENELNKLGLLIVMELNGITSTFYWWHLEEDEKLDNCPKCNRRLDLLLRNELGDSKICQDCKILIRN